MQNRACLEGTKSRRRRRLSCRLIIAEYENSCSFCTIELREHSDIEEALAMLNTID